MLTLIISKQSFEYAHKKSQNSSNLFVFLYRKSGIIIGGIIKNKYAKKRYKQPGFGRTLILIWMMSI